MSLSTEVKACSLAPQMRDAAAISTSTVMPPSTSIVVPATCRAWPARDGVPALEVGFGASWTPLWRGLAGEQTKSIPRSMQRRSVPVIEDVRASPFGNLAGDFRTVFGAKPNGLTLPREQAGCA